MDFLIKLNNTQQFYHKPVCKIPLTSLLSRMQVGTVGLKDTLLDVNTSRHPNVVSAAGPVAPVTKILLEPQLSKRILRKKMIGSSPEAKLLIFNTCADICLVLKTYIHCFIIFY